MYLPYNEIDNIADAYKYLIKMIGIFKDSDILEN